MRDQHEWDEHDEAAMKEGFATNRALKRSRYGHLAPKEEKKIKEEKKD